ncbi:MAG: polysaccharide deacetylase family protein [Lewinellaceae bacterium]|nr:polysaccharide deacetylase family protein [Lewinellaceae bacterium]
MISGIKPMLSFELRRNPRIAARPENFDNFIPEGYDGVLIISADFELAWAWRYAKKLTNPKEEAEQYARQARRNIPLILDLCEQYNIPVTWATVGHLFLDRCDRKEGGLPHPELKRLAHFENNFWKFEGSDWFEHDPCTSVEENDAWYAPDLIRKIIDSPVGHEIGCHTFSHIDCRDGVCPEAILRDELRACQEAAGRFGIQLESFIFPGHTLGNFKTLKECGYTAIRTNYANVIGYPEMDEYGLWRFPVTAEMTMNPRLSKKYNVYRFQKIIELTLKHRAVANYWFHPSLPGEDIPELFENLFRFINKYRDRLWIGTMKDYTKHLNEHCLA